MDHPNGGSLALYPNNMLVRKGMPQTNSVAFLSNFFWRIRDKEKLFDISETLWSQIHPTLRISVCLTKHTCWFLLVLSRYHSSSY